MNAFTAADAHPDGRCRPEIRTAYDTDDADVDDIEGCDGGIKYKPLMTLMALMWMISKGVMAPTRRECGYLGCLIDDHAE